MKKWVGLIFLFTFFGLIINIIRFWPDGKLHLIFCDVGQGDAIYIRFPNSSDMLVDGGPRNRKVLACLSTAMPFYDRKIDVVMLTHPQADHMGGLFDVLKRYQVDYFVVPVVGNTTKSYQQLIDLLEKRNIQLKNLYSGEKIYFGDSVVKVVWPDKNWTLLSLGQASCLVDNHGICVGESLTGDFFDKTPVGDQIISGGLVLGAATEMDLNKFSLVAQLSYGQFDAILTSDIDENVEWQILSSGEPAGLSLNEPIEILKVPHHGSRSGLSPSFLDSLSPRLAVISVGKNNRYGHPAPEIIKLLQERGIDILRTDERGTVEIVSDGENWQVMTK